MTLQGHIENGHVVLDVPMGLPDGTKVTVVVQPNDDAPQSAETFPSLYERLKPVAGKAKGLPTDLAINHDHYLHGQPKRQ
jgi:hypothetical protein